MERAVVLTPVGIILISGHNTLNIQCVGNFTGFLIQVDEIEFFRIVSAGSYITQFMNRHQLIPELRTEEFRHLGTENAQC